jgi:hypothetical protein
MISFDEFIDFDYKINSSDTNEILLGNASASSLTFSVWNADKKYNTYRFKNGTCFLYKDEERTKKVGEFKIDKITKNKNTLSFECTDYMTKLDEIFKGIQTPFTIFSLIVQICTQLDLKLRNTESDFSHLTYKYNDTNDILGKKCRDVIKWIGEISCKYVIFDEEGQLYFNWYDLDTIKKEIPYNKLKDFSRDESELSITGVSVLIDKEEEIVGTKKGYDLRLTTDNPFLKVLDKEDRKQILTHIYNKVYGMNYLSCDISLSVDDEINIGDTLKIYDEDGEVYKIIVSYLNINKLFSMKITSSGENLNRDIEAGSNSSGGGSTQQQKEVHSAKDEIWRDINLRNFKGETFLNSISIFGVNEKSSAFLSFSIEFDIDVEAILKFKFYINDSLTKIFTYNATMGTNIFNWSEGANIKLDSDVNVFKFTLDTSDLLDNYIIQVDKEKSVLSVVSIGAKAGANVITSLEFKEDVKPIRLLDFRTNKLILKSFDDTISVIYQNYIDNDLSEKVDLINFKSRNKLTINNINESIE